MKTLAMDTILANARFFDGDLSKVPTMALTVGVGTVMDAREVRKEEVAPAVPLEQRLSCYVSSGAGNSCTECLILLSSGIPQHHGEALAVCWHLFLCNPAAAVPPGSQEGWGVSLVGNLTWGGTAGIRLS